MVAATDEQKTDFLDKLNTIFLLITEQVTVGIVGGLSST